MSFLALPPKCSGRPIVGLEVEIQSLQNRKAVKSRRSISSTMTTVEVPPSYTLLGSVLPASVEKFGEKSANCRHYYNTYSAGSYSSANPFLYQPLLRLHPAAWISLPSRHYLSLHSCRCQEQGLAPNSLFSSRICFPCTPRGIWRGILVPVNF